MKYEGVPHPLPSSAKVLAECDRKWFTTHIRVARREALPLREGAIIMMMTNGLLPHDDHDGTHAPKGKRDATKLRVSSPLLSLYTVDGRSYEHWCVRGIFERAMQRVLLSLLTEIEIRETENACLSRGAYTMPMPPYTAEKTQGYQVAKAQQ